MSTATITAPSGPGRGLWRAGRRWPAASTDVEVASNEFTEIELRLLAANAARFVADNTARLLGLWTYTGADVDINVLTDLVSPASLTRLEVLDGFNLWTPRQLAPVDDATFASLAADYDVARSTTAPGELEDSSIRTVIGQRACRLLQADQRLTVELE
ncbi:MAG TPA: hypothetical protein VHO06_12565 [Polyangia bacterium]|nr:hypothetical protein [Polyangia bacterium]